MTDDDEYPIILNIMISLIFILVATMFLFPSNQYIPIDRRLSGLIGSVLCISLKTLFKHSKNEKFSENIYNPVDLIDYSVLLILVAIMIMNYIIMKQEIVIYGIEFMQEALRYDISLGIWLLSSLAFILSPFVTNDGFCLLIVDPILDSFMMNYQVKSHGLRQHYFSLFQRLKPLNHHENEISNDLDIELDHKTNRFFILLSIACSSNIGSVLTYTGAKSH